MFQKPFVVVDLETSGTDPKRDAIIELAAIRYEKGKETDRLDALIKIDADLPPIITAITGITSKELKTKGQPGDKILKKTEVLLKDAYLVGHNVNFDLGFLKGKNVPLEIRGVLDTIPLAQIAFPEALSYSLESLTDDLEIPHETRHRALADAEATAMLFEKIWNKLNALSAPVIAEIQRYIKYSPWEGGVIFEELKGVRHPEGAIRESRLQDAHHLSPSKPLPPDEIFAPGGLLRKTMEGAEHRPQQEEMAQAILNAFQKNYHLICEAPTGVGKSLAYLAAAAHQALSNKSKVVISTHTLNLQEQLYEKDLPILRALYQAGTGSDGPRAAVLKGRTHYLCRRRLTEFKKRSRFKPAEMILLIKILAWQSVTQTGDSGEIHLTQEENLIWNFELCADPRFCSPKKCLPAGKAGNAYGTCYLYQARQKAEEADLVIVNHALLCADIQNGGGLLPEYNNLVIDEAHQFEEAATEALGVEISHESFRLPIQFIETTLQAFQKKLEKNLFLDQTLFQDFNSFLNEIPALQQGLDNFFTVVALFVNRNVPDSGYNENLLIDQAITGMAEWLNLSASMDEIIKQIKTWTASLTHLKNRLLLTSGLAINEQENLADSLTQTTEALLEEADVLKLFFEDETASPLKPIRWMTSYASGKVSLHTAPLLLGPILEEKLYSQKKSVVLTSATLQTPAINEEKNSHPFTYIRQILGLGESFEEIALSSPFHFETQSYILIPTDTLPLSSSSSMPQVADFFKKLIGTLKGGILGLFTSYGAIESLYLRLMSAPFKETALLAQRISGGRHKIMKAYLNHPESSVLLGTSSFWEGIDIKGDALHTLVIHKFPFDVPSNPVFAARSQLFANRFMDYAVPRALLRFRQGFGRLIRSAQDHGVMIILDNRVTAKDFGQLFLKVLPKGIAVDRLPLLKIPEKVKEWLELVTKP